MPIELMGGPLDGDLHELLGSKPAKIGLVLNERRHWYIVDRYSDTAQYEHSEGASDESQRPHV